MIKIRQLKMKSGHEIYFIKICQKTKHFKLEKKRHGTLCLVISEKSYKEKEMGYR
jgi:hypothetical protein